MRSLDLLEDDGVHEFERTTRLRRPRDIHPDQLAGESCADSGIDDALLHPLLHASTSTSIPGSHASGHDNRSSDRFRSELGVGLSVGLPITRPRPVDGSKARRTQVLRDRIHRAVHHRVSLFLPHAGQGTAPRQRGYQSDVPPSCLVRPAIELFSLVARWVGGLHHARRRAHTRHRRTTDTDANSFFWVVLDGARRIRCGRDETALCGRSRRWCLAGLRLSLVHLALRAKEHGSC
jgi:hypothetical protein